MEREKAQSTVVNLHVSNMDHVAVISGSLRKYKHTIADLADSNIHPHKLYDIKPRQFIYNFDYLSQNDCRFGMLIPGFIIDELAYSYPSTVRL